MTEFSAADAKRVRDLVTDRIHLEGPLLPILHAVQADFGCVPRGAIPLIAEALNLSRAEVYGVVSFYHDFRETPGGRRVVKLCRAEACQATGGRSLCEEVLKHFRLNWGETTSDGGVTIEAVYCLGLCSVAPAALIDGEPYGRAQAKHIIAIAERDA